MKTKFCIASTLLLMSVAFLSCDSKESNEVDPVLKNQFVIDETITPIKGLMVSYQKSTSDKATSNTKKAYPLDIYLYGSQPYFQDLSNQNFKMLENSAPMIHFKLYTSANGKLDLGNYVWDKNSTEAGNCALAWQSTNFIEHSVLPDNKMISKYELVYVSKPNLRINKVGDELYEFIFDAIDYNGAPISGYYKGRINLTLISSQD